MAQTDRGVTMRGIDWRQTLHFTELFRGFRIATQPGKIMTALLLVILMFVVGWVLDGLVGGQRVVPGEFNMYVEAPGVEAFHEQRRQRQEAVREDLAWLLRRELEAPYAEASETAAQNDRWRAAERMIQSKVDDADRRAALMRDLRELRPRGVFATALEIKVESFGNLIQAAWGAVSALDWQRLGLSQLDPRQPLNPETALGAVRTVALALPGWLWATQPWFLVIWTALFILVWSLLGGAISRLAVVEAATGERVGMSAGIRFAFRRWLSFVLAPLLPLLFFGLIALALMVGGLLFHVPGLDILAALLWGLAIGAGIIIAVGLIAWTGAVNLMYPALAAEATDVFDAISRSYSYVVTRPWKFLWRLLVALIYGTITYAFVGLVMYLTAYVARQATAAWSAPFAAMLPMPEFGDLRGGLGETNLGGTDLVASVVIRVWFMLLISVIAAYAISYYFAALSLMYLLLRRDCDGTDLSQVHGDGDGEAPVAAPADKAEGVDPPDDQ